MFIHSNLFSLMYVFKFLNMRIHFIYNDKRSEKKCIYCSNLKETEIKNMDVKYVH